MELTLLFNIYLVISSVGAFVLLPIVKSFCKNTELPLLRKSDVFGMIIIFFIPFLNAFLFLGFVIELCEQISKNRLYKKYPGSETLAKLKKIEKFFWEFENLEASDLQKSEIENKGLYSPKITKLVGRLKKNYKKQDFSLLLFRYDYAFDQILSFLGESNNEDLTLKILDETKTTFDDIYDETEVLLEKEKAFINETTELSFKKYQEAIQNERKLQKERKFPTI